MTKQKRNRIEIKENNFLVYLGIILRNIVNVIKGILGFILKFIGLTEIKMVIIFLFLYILYNFFHYFFDYFFDYFFQIEYSSNLSGYKEFISNSLILFLIFFCIYNFGTGKKKVKREKVEEEKTKDKNVEVFAEDDEQGPLIVSEPDEDL